MKQSDEMDIFFMMNLSWKWLDKYSLYNVSMYIGQPVLPALITESQLGMIDATKVKNSRLHIMNMNRIFDGVPTEIIGSAIHATRFDTAPRHPPAKRFAKMITTLGVRRITLAKRRTAKLSAPNYQGIIKHATFF
jgi:hypothetical protein